MAIKFTTNYVIHCTGELKEDGSTTTHTTLFPFSYDTNYNIECNELIEDSSVTNIKYDNSTKKLYCNEIVEE